MGEVDSGARRWSIVGLTIFMSVVMHGITVTPLTRVLDGRHGRNADAE